MNTKRVMSCFFCLKENYIYAQSQRIEEKKIIRDIIMGSRLYAKFLVPYDFLIVTSDGKYHEVRFHK